MNASARSLFYRKNDDCLSPNGSISAERSRSVTGSARSNGRGNILVLGEPRSGTSWLAKLFDSHPDVLYRHEPDIVRRPDSLPKFASRSQEEAYLDAARMYLESLTAIRTLKSTGPSPAFPKRHRSGLARALRTGFILGVKGIHVAARGQQGASRIPIPDLISRRSRQDIRIAIKSVSLLPYVRLLARAWPQSRIIVIVRHPCGQVASIMRGVELGKLIAVPFTDLARSKEAERLGLKVENLAALSTVEQLAWEWAFSNERMLREINGLNNVKMVVYEDLAADPVNVAQSLFEFADLSWDPQVERFIKDSTQHHETRFYSLKRNPLYAANRWREALSADDQRRISAIVSRAAVGRAFLAPPSDRSPSPVPDRAIPAASGSTS